MSQADLVAAMTELARVRDLHAPYPIKRIPAVVVDAARRVAEVKAGTVRP